MDKLSGTRIGNCNIINLLSQDAESSLYLAEDDSEQKLFLEIASYAASETAVTGRHSYQQLSPRVLSDAGLTPDGQLFTVTPFAKGSFLADTLQENPGAFTPYESLSLMCRLATIVAHAHENDLYHAHIRPETIWVTEDNQLFLFGWTEQAPPPQENGSSRQVDTIAPEYRKDAVRTAQTDIYSIGVLLYTLLATHPPQVPQTDWDIFAQGGATQVIPLENVRPGLATATYQLVRNCLWRQPWNRYDTIQELITDLDAAQAAEAPVEKAVKTVPVAAGRRFAGMPRLVMIAAIIVVLLGGGFFLFQGRQNSAAPVPTQTAVPAILVATETATQTAVPTETAIPSATTIPSATNLPAATPTIAPTETAVPATDTPIPTIESTNTPAPTATNTQTAVPSTTVPPVVDCVPTQPNGWTVYSVQADDFLFNLALETGTTVERIQEVNCLTGVNLFVGQVLYLPALPATNTPTPEPTTVSDDSGGSSDGSPSGPRSTRPPTRKTPTPPPPP